MSSQVRTYTAKERNMYLVGMMGQNMIYNIIGTGLYFYFQSVIFIPAMAISGASADRICCFHRPLLW